MRAHGEPALHPDALFPEGTKAWPPGRSGQASRPQPTRGGGAARSARGGTMSAQRLLSSGRFSGATELCGPGRLQSRHVRSCGRFWYSFQVVKLRAACRGRSGSRGEGRAGRCPSVFPAFPGFASEAPGLWVSEEEVRLSRASGRMPWQPQCPRKLVSGFLPWMDLLRPLNTRGSSQDGCPVRNAPSLLLS